LISPPSIKPSQKATQFYHIKSPGNLLDSFIMGAVVSCVKGMLQAIGAGIMAVVRGVGAIITGIVNGEWNLLHFRESFTDLASSHRLVLRGHCLMPHLRPRWRWAAEEDNDESSIIKDSLKPTTWATGNETTKLKRESPDAQLRTERMDRAWESSLILGKTTTSPSFETT
jgi:hypothetical protein